MSIKKMHVKTFAKGMCLLACLVASTLPKLMANDRDQLNDLIARVQFAAYAADDAALQRDLQLLKALPTPEPMQPLQQYYVVYGYWKLALTLELKERSKAHKAATACVAASQQLISNEPKRVHAYQRSRLDDFYGELWSIQGSCVAIETSMAVLPKNILPGSNKAWEKASVLAPNNPRVKLLAAIQQSKQAKTTQDRATVSAQFLAVVKLFDVLPPAEPGMPDWGQAEALAWLGKSQIESGDVIAARNTLERALIIAPDFAWARKLQKQLEAVN
jgi:hypothetical protein